MTPVSQEVQNGHQSPCKIRMRHTLSRHRVTPDAFTLANSYDEHKECVMCWVFRLPKEPVIHRDSRYLFCLLLFRVNFAMPRTHTEHQLRKSNCETLCDCRNMLQLFCLLNHILISICRTEFIINSLKTEFISTRVTTLLDTHINVCFRTCDWAYG